MKDTITRTAELLHTKGVDSFELNAHTSIGTSFSVRMGEVENSTRYENQGLDITITNEGKSASISTVDISQNGITSAIEQVVSLATFSSVDEYNTLAPKELMPTQQVELDLYHPYDLTSSEGIKRALVCENGALAHKQVINSEGCEVASFYGTSYYFNSHDILLTQQKSSHSLALSVIASDAKGNMQTAYEYDNALAINELTSPEIIGSKCGDTATRKLNPQTISSGKYPVVLYHTVSASFIGSIFSALSGRAQYKKSSFLLDSLDSIILPEHMSITESPLTPHTIGARYFDSDGVVKTKRTFIDHGRVASYVLSQYSANKLGMTTTGNAGGVSNVRVDSAEIKTFNELIWGIDKGILVDEMFGQGVNYTTGDYSRGVCGFMIENGVITYPVSGITIAGNLKDMYQNITAIADDVDMRKNIKVGSVLLSSMTIAGS